MSKQQDNTQVDISKALQRLKGRKKKNRYYKFSKNFYMKVQNAFLKIARKNQKRYLVLDNSKDSNVIERLILKKLLSKLMK